MPNKRNYNPRSRENLRQYQAASQKKNKEEITKEILDQVSIDEDLLELIVAAEEVCANKKEKERFRSYVKEYIKEYSKKVYYKSMQDEFLKKQYLERIKQHYERNRKNTRTRI